MKSIAFDSVVWKEGEHFVAQCLNVEVSSFGDTKDDAHTNLKEALELYYEGKTDINFKVIEKPEIVHAEITYV